MGRIKLFKLQDVFDVLIILNITIAGCEKDFPLPPGRCILRKITLNIPLANENALLALMLLHKYSNLNVQVRIKDWKSKVQNLKDLENLVWGF